jgi:tetratricopeptide (TPR) repeat protein
MNKRRAVLLLLSVLTLIVYSQIGGVFSGSRDSLPDPEKIDGSALANVPPVADAIQAIQKRVKQNPRDAVSYTLLGELYIRQARETGDVSAYQRAEESLGRALELLPSYSPASSSLASVYYAQHEFRQALGLAEQVYENNPKNSQARIIMADSYLSLGDTQQAEAIYAELAQTNTTPPLLARIAYLEELKGNPDQALELIRRAAGEALDAGGTKENVAWYLLRVGDMYFNAGDIRESAKFYAGSLRIFDNYHLALAGLGKVRAAEGKYDEAITYYQRAVNIIPTPELLAALGDLYTITDQPAQAQLQYETVEYIGKLGALNQQVYNRQLANFYSDHDMNPKEALRLALAELEVRKDIYAYDAAAWAHYKNGHFEEAQALMDQALALGTRDAQLHFHAGMIALALGDEAQSRAYLEQALTINPHFSILYASEAQKTLQSLQNIESK